MSNQIKYRDPNQLPTTNRLPKYLYGYHDKRD